MRATVSSRKPSASGESWAAVRSMTPAALSRRTRLRQADGVGQRLVGDRAIARQSAQDAPVDRIKREIGIIHGLSISNARGPESATEKEIADCSVRVVALSQRLAQMLPPDLSRALFLSTGSDANEAAIKLAKLRSGRYEIVSPNAYLCPVRHCRDTCDGTCLEIGFDMVDAQSTGSLAALIAEPVESSGGVIVPPDGYWQKVKEQCQKRGMMLFFDEAQTAFGRLGRDFAFQHFGVEPDILTLSKTLGGGLPLSATVISDEMETACHAKGFIHATSHVSDPLPAHVALAVLDVLEEEALNDRALAMGRELAAGLRWLHDRHEIIGDVRGFGSCRVWSWSRPGRPARPTPPRPRHHCPLHGAQPFDECRLGRADGGGLAHRPTAHGQQGRDRARHRHHRPGDHRGAGQRQAPGSRVGRGSFRRDRTLQVAYDFIASASLGPAKDLERRRECGMKGGGRGKSWCPETESNRRPHHYE